MKTRFIVGWIQDGRLLGRNPLGRVVAISLKWPSLLIPDHAPLGSCVFETGGAAVENTSLMMYRRWGRRAGCSLGDRESSLF